MTTEEEIESIGYYVADCISGGMSADEVKPEMFQDKDLYGLKTDDEDGAFIFWVISEGKRFRITTNLLEDEQIQ